MKIGTKTLLFGNHQFILHPACVYISWVRLYRRLPSWRETLCIAIHDWGYWGKPNIDGPEGELHPVWAAVWAARHFGPEHWCLISCHSKTLADRRSMAVSRLYLPDKMGAVLPPVWLLTILGRLSGETEEYRHCPKYADRHRGNMNDREYFNDVKKGVKELVAQRRGL